MYYGIHYNIEFDNLGGVRVENGDTPFPEGAIFPVPFELRSTPSQYLKVNDGKIEEKTLKEKTFWGLPPKYKKQVDGIWVELSQEEKRILDLPSKYKHADGSEMSQEEKDAVDAAEASAAEAARQAAESARQAAKSLSVKTAENSFLYFCDQLTGATSHEKLGFAQLRQIIQSLPQEQEVVISIQLLSIDAELKREAGNLWWDDCAWHPEIT